MKKITASLDDEARIEVVSDSGGARLKRLEQELRCRVPAGFRAADRLTRHKVYERDA